jgi:hypothetical protein
VCKNEIFYAQLLNFNQAFPKVGSPVSSEEIKYQAFSTGLGATDGDLNLHQLPPSTQNRTQYVENLEIEAIGYKGTSLWSKHEHSEERNGIGLGLGLGQQNIRALTRAADQDMNQMRVETGINR